MDWMLILEIAIGVLIAFIIKGIWVSFWD